MSHRVEKPDNSGTSRNWDLFRTIQVCPKDLSFGGTLSLLHCDRKEYPTMSGQAAEERRGWASDIVWVVLYSMVVLLIMVLSVHVPA